MLDFVNKKQTQVRNVSHYERQKNDARLINKLIAFNSPRLKKRAANSIKLQPLHLRDKKFSLDDTTGSFGSQIEKQFMQSPTFGSGKGYYNLETDSFRKTTFEQQAQFGKQFKEEEHVLEQRNLQSPDQIQYLKDKIHLDHQDSDPDNQIDSNDVQFGDKKVSLSPYSVKKLRQDKTLKITDQNFNMGPGLTLSMANLNLLKEAPSSDEDSPLRKFQPKKNKQGFLEKITQEERIGLPKIKNYYQVYRKMNKALDLKIDNDSEVVAQLKALQLAKCIPVTNQLVSYKGSKTKINASNFQMGNDRALALSSALKLTEATQVNLKYNRLSPFAGKSILENINQNVLELNLENNMLGKNDVFIDSLIQNMEQSNFAIQGLNLNKNHFSDNQVKRFCKAMIENKNETIRKIKLGNNGLTDKTAKWFLKVFERSNTSLEVLDLSWNKLEYNGGMCIGEIVRRDPNLKIIDLSWNCISKRPPIKEKANADRIKKLQAKHAGKDLPDEFDQTLGEKWGYALEINTNLLHLDLSFNKIDEHDTAALATHLVENEILFGIHYTGNQGRIDSMGYMHPIVSQFANNPRTWHLAQKISGTKPTFKQRKMSTLGQYEKPGMLPPIQSKESKSGLAMANSPSRQALSPLGMNYDLNWNSMSARGEMDPDNHTGGVAKQDNCWICEGWIEANFSVDLLDNVPDAVVTPVDLDACPPEFNRTFLHCDFDQWQPDMTTDEAIQYPTTHKGKHQVYRMLPKNTVMYFYSHNGVPFVDKNAPMVEIDDLITDDINKNFYNAELAKQQAFEAEEEHKAVLKAKAKKDGTRLEVKKVHPPAGAAAFSQIIIRDERRNIDDLPENEKVRPENRYAINLEWFDLGMVNIMGTEDIVEEATYQQRLDQGYTQKHLLKIKHAKSNDNLHYHENDKEADGVTTKLPPKLPPYKLFLDGYKCTASHCKPRQNRDPTVQKGPRVRTPWVYENGIFFKDFVNEHQPQKSAQCFEKDWGMVKFAKLKISTEGECKEIMRKHYALLKDCYKDEAGIGTVGKVFGVPKGQMTAFLQELEIIDGEFGISALDLQYVTVDKRPQDLKTPMIVANSLVRFQFLEFWIRTSIEKYFTKGVDSEADAIKLMCEKHLVPNKANSGAHQWRLDFLWNEPVDNMLKCYKSFFEQIYKRNSSQKRPGTAVSMSCEEFTKIFEASVGLINDCFPIRDCSLFFFQSMMTQVDEVESDRHQCMSFIEFLEAVVRVIYKSSPAPPKEMPEEGEEEAEEADEEPAMSIEDRRAQSLSVKIENAIPILNKLLPPTFMQKQFKPLPKDESEDLYILPNGGFF